MTTDMNFGAKPESRKAILIQIISSVIASSTLLSSGMSLGFSGVALPHMEAPDSLVKVGPQEASWIASLANLATPVGCLLVGPLLDRLGRKNTMIFVGVPAVCGWLLIAVEPSLPRVYLGRLLTGLATGLSSIPSTVYTSEITSNAMRGILVTCSSISIAVGILTEYCLGWWFQRHWHCVALVSGVISILVSGLVLIGIPESPVWLVSRGQNQEASKALCTLRGTKSKNKIEKELNQIIENCRAYRGRSTSIARSISGLALPQAYKPLIIMNTYFLFQQVSGLFVIVFYAVDVIKIAGVTADAYLIAVLIAFLRLVTIIVSVWVNKAFGRRFASIISGVGITLSMFALVGYCYFVPGAAAPTPVLVNSTTTTTSIPQALVGSTDAPIPMANFSLVENVTVVMSESFQGVHGLSWIPIAALFVHIVFGTIGFLTVPWCMIGEVFPAQVRGVACSITSCFAYLSSFVVIKLYKSMLMSMGTVGIFTFYGIMSLLGTLFVMIYLPETKGKSFEAIEKHFANGSGVPASPEEVSLQTKNSKQPIIRPSRPN
ncbi:unnamed protein product [Bemisia tabaci]|uniref:Major facilitator superfamily (MFS) profile domain-containing protein n=1 Tax=Bemisia tabaci TaxID=7038 RepID=A0A9P0F1M4_BEMTA|nr:unnamed protein product [Bemisia tabaci]